MKDYFMDVEGLQITSVRIIEERLNFTDAIEAMTVLDQIISGSIGSTVVADHNYGLIIRHFFDYILCDNPLQEEFPMHPYVYNTFKCFASHKTEIRFLMDFIDKYVEDQKLLDSLFYDIVKAEEAEKEGKQFDIDQNDGIVDRYQNLIKSEVLEIFPNLRHITIVATSMNGKSIYPLDESTLLEIVDDTNVNGIRISARENKPCGHRWIKRFATNKDFESKSAKKFSIDIDITDSYKLAKEKYATIVKEFQRVD